MAGADLRKHWTVDLMTASVTHDSGFSVRFITLPLPGSNPESSADEAPLCKCQASDGREWWVVMTSARLNETLADLIARHGPHVAQEMLARLSREAGDVWTGVKMREH